MSCVAEAGESSRTTALTNRATAATASSSSASSTTAGEGGSHEREREDEWAKAIEEGQRYAHPLGCAL